MCKFLYKMRCKHCGVPMSYYKTAKHAHRRSCRVNGFHKWEHFWEHYWDHYCTTLCTTLCTTPCTWIKSFNMARDPLRPVQQKKCNRLNPKPATNC